MTIAIEALASPGPSTAATAIASRIGGKETVTSTSRMMMLSFQPPKKPASAPRVEPMTTAQATTTKAIGIDQIAPYIVRAKTSRPSASVPSQCSPDGG